MEIVVRASLTFFFLWLLTRGLGRRELTQLSAFELILFVIMGDIIQQAVTQEDMSLVGGFLAVGTIGVWILVFSFVSYRWKRARGVMEGLPIVVVREGALLDKALKRERLTDDEVRMAARKQGIDDLADVAFGIFEPDGRFSFIQSESSEQTQQEEEPKGF